MNINLDFEFKKIFLIYLKYNNFNIYQYIYVIPLLEYGISFGKTTW